MGVKFSSDSTVNQYLENMNILNEEQAGFRKHYSTTDHIFNLKCLIDLYLCGGRQLKGVKKVRSAL